MKSPIGWLLFTFLLLTLTVMARVTYQRDQASQQLIAAVNTHDAPCVEALLNQGADPNIRDWKTYYEGFDAPYRPPWYEKYLAKLMRRPPRSADLYVGPTVLMIAAHFGDTAIVQKLLDHAADPAKLGTPLTSNSGSTIASPLWEAAANQQHGTEAALLLIRRGAPVNPRSLSEATVLPETKSLAIITALINKGADINAADDSGNTALSNAVRRSDYPITQFLLEKGASPEAPPRNLRTPSMWAVIRYPPLNPTLPLLLSHGANVNARDGFSSTILIIAARTRNLPAMKLLLLHGADVNAQDYFGSTALMLSARRRFPADTLQWKRDRSAMQSLLYHYGANPYLKDKRGKTATDYEHKWDPISRRKVWLHNASGVG